MPFFLKLHKKWQNVITNENTFSRKKKRNGRITDGFVSHTSNDATWRKSDVTTGTRRDALATSWFALETTDYEQIRFGYTYSLLFFYSYINKLSNEKSF